MTPSESISDLLERGDDEGIAIGAPEGGAPLRYRDLRALARRTVAGERGEAGCVGGV